MLQIDDPVGVVGAHGAAALWGLTAVGLFSNPELIGVDVKRGLFRGGGFEFVGIQLLGAVVLVSWAGVITLFLFSFMRATVGIRVSPEDEAKGADAIEHLCDPEHYCHQEPDSSATQE